MDNKVVYKDIWIKKDMTEGEKIKPMDLLDWAKEKKANGTEEKKKKILRVEFEIKKVVLETRRERRKELKISYTEADGLTLVRWKLDRYLQEKNPHIMGVTETKLSDETEVFNIGEGKYKVWKRKRKNKHGVGVMFMIKNKVTVEEVVFGEELAEVLKVIKKDI